MSCKLGLASCRSNSSTRKYASGLAPQRPFDASTDPVDVVSAEEGERELVRVRWGLIPRWWSKTIKDAKIATFNARAETVETKPFFRDAFKRTRCLIPMS